MGLGVWVGGLPGGSLVAGGFVGWGCVGGWTVGGGALVGGEIVGVSGAGGVGVTRAPPDVGEGTAVLAFWVGRLIGALRVLTGVKKTGAKGVAAPGSGQGCRVTGNCRQLELSEQIFKVNDVDCAPLQIRMRIPFSTLAVRQFTGVDEFTSK